MLFLNLEEIIAANKMLLCELEILYDSGAAQGLKTLGDVMLQNMRRFNCYDEYIGGFEHAKDVYNQMLKQKGFRDFIERTQHSITDIGNSGLRELMIEPPQRLPRYQLLIGNLIKHMPENSLQRRRLQEASYIAGQIASRKVSRSAQRAAVLRSCERRIDGFPKELVDSRRMLLACLDVDDLDVERSQHTGMLNAIGTALTGGRRRRSSTRTSQMSVLLFDDVLVLVHRAAGTSAHQVLGVRDPEKLAEELSAPENPKGAKKALAFAGMADLGSIKATGTSDFEFELFFDVKMPGSEYGPSTRRFRDATDLPGANLHKPGRIAQFLEFLWRTQATLGASEDALELRTILASENEHRSACHLFWTVRTQSQFLRADVPERLLVHIGSLDAAEKTQLESRVKDMLNVDLHEDMPTGTVTISKLWGAQKQTIVVALADIVGLCADLCMHASEAFVEHVSEAQQDAVDAVEVPVRRAQSLQTPRSKSSRQVHRARSMMSQRALQSIQSSLQSVHEDVHGGDDEDMEVDGKKRHLPLNEIGNSPLKRRALDSLEKEKTYPGGDISRDSCRGTLPTLDEHEDELSYAGKSMTADKTLDLPNPFDVYCDPQPTHNARSDADTPQPGEQTPKAVQSREEDAEVQALLCTFEQQASDRSASVSAYSVAGEHEHDSEMHRDDATADEDEQEADATVVVRHDDTGVSAADETALAVEASLSRATSHHSSVLRSPPAQMEETPLKAPESRSAASMSQCEETPIKRHVSSTGERDATTETLVRDGASVMFAEPEEPKRRTKAGGMSTSLTIGDFELPEMVEMQPAPLRAEELFDQMVASDTEEDECILMRGAIRDLNEKIASLRRYRPKVHNPNWLNDWLTFKYATKTLNTRWTQMERAFEHKQMRLASLELSQEDRDDRVRISKVEHAKLLDEANLIAPLRIQIDQLSQKCDALASLEKDTRLENAELYSVRQLD